MADVNYSIPSKDVINAMPSMTTEVLINLFQQTFFISHSYDSGLLDVQMEVESELPKVNFGAFCR